MKLFIPQRLQLCQAKPDCDAAPLRAERDAVVAEKKRYYVTQHQLMLEKIKTDMAELDEKVKPLNDKQSELHHEKLSLSLQEKTRKKSMNAGIKILPTCAVVA